MHVGCVAEHNGRLSSTDYALLKECIIKSGRPMVLSISDFGQGAWVWGGTQLAHLWRTSGDIFPFIQSVYNHADTSAGDRVIHPAFNGLWQFAGPGHWNDPDMLEVGNLKTNAEDKVHFSLWCILAAPLMAGNDLRSMSDAARDILTAPEVIQVNQDSRGIQGYKVKGRGCLASCRVMYKLNRATDRFQATVGLDDSYDGEAAGRFRVWNEDHFGREVLFDSGPMSKNDPPETVDSTRSSNRRRQRLRMRPATRPAAPLDRFPTHR